MRTVSLFDICNPKQWKTISMEHLTDNGYPVYGANGKIGYYHSYTHEKPTLLITCRGATCGTLNISEPFSYVNGNAMALDELSSEVDLHYLYFYLLNRNLHDVISGSAQPQITRTGLEKVRISLPPLPIQKKIAAVLEKADELRCKREEQIKRLDDLLQATFLDMFGDPVTNPKGFCKRQIGMVAKVDTGGTPSRDRKDFYANGTISWVKTTEVNGTRINVTQERITPEAIQSSNCKLFPVDTVLIAMYGQGKTRGQVGILGVEATTNQACAAILPTNPEIKMLFLFHQLRLLYENLRELGRGGNQPNLNLSIIKSFEVLVPSSEKQDAFVKLAINNEQQKLLETELCSKTTDLFNSLMQRAFKGELDLK